MAKLMPPLVTHFDDDNGNPLVGGKVFFYEAGTSTPKNTFTDANSGIPNPNPVVLNARGDASIWLTAGEPYKAIIKRADDSVVRTVDFITRDAADDATYVALEAAEAARDVAIEQAGIATAQAVIATEQRVLSEAGRVGSETARTGSEAARDAALLSRGVFASTADALSKGVNQLSITGNGSGGTNGAGFKGTFTGGGGTAAEFSFTVAGGAIVPSSVVITASGKNYTSAPTGIDVSASAGLTGVTFTAGIGFNASVGEYFAVVLAGSDYEYIWYRVDAGPVATEVVRGAKANVLLPSFDIILPKNLYNPALAVDGFIYNFVGGTAGAFATSIISGYVPVVEGNTYTLWQKSPEKGFFDAVYCYDASLAYLGMSKLVTSNPVVAGMGLVASDPGGTGGYRKITFTIPIGSGVAYIGALMLYNYAAHTTEDFDRIRNATQLEIGSVATSFEAYGTPAKAYIKEEYLPDTLQLSAPVAPIIDGFTVTQSRNLYDKSVAVDGHLISYGTGMNVAFATGMALGYFPVEPGKTYTLSMGDSLGFDSQRPLYCRDANGSYLGVDHTIGATPGMASPPTGVVWTGNNTVTFTISIGSAIRYVGCQAAYSTHNLTDFNRVIGSIQAEEGVEATAYQRYAPYGLISPKDQTTTPSTVTMPLLIERVGDDIYIRSSFDSTHDLVQKVSLSGGAGGTVNVMGAKKMPVIAEGAIGGWTNGVLLVSQGDDTAPLQYNNTYIGANHGASFVKEVTATAHGKAVQDVGSEWTDSASRKWYLLKIVDANKLWFLSENLAVYPAWSFAATITGSTLTHSVGATNTGAITVASFVTTRLYPALQGQTAKVLLDGITEVSADGLYRCMTLDVVNSYTIPNPADVIEFLKTQTGSSTQPSFVDISIDADVRRTTTYRYAENGSSNIVDSVQVLQPITLNYFGATQAGPLAYSGKQLWQYIPRVNPVVGGIKTWDFKAQENISGSFEVLNFGTSTWSDANNPPDRMAQIVKTAGVPEFGLMVGYSPLRSVGVPALRKTLVSNACFLSSNRKQYPRAIDVGGLLPVGSYFEIIAFRSYWSASTNLAATCFVWYRDGKSIIVVADFHQNVSLSKLPLPPQFTGMDVAVVDKSASMTLHGNGVLAADGLLVSVTGGYGYGVFKLS